MNSSAQQAKNGFKTFLLTFSLSIFVLGVLYYAVSQPTATDVNIESETASSTNQLPQQGTDTESPFGQLASNNQQGAVLSGDDENDPTSFGGGGGTEATTDTTTQTGTTEATTQVQQTAQPTVPDTGFTSITVGLAIAMTLFAIFAYILIMGPRKYALSKFEQNVREDL